jgi:hypothetical protein
VASASFLLTVGGEVSAEAPPAPVIPALGLSVRRGSFLLDETGLP